MYRQPDIFQTFFVDQKFDECYQWPENVGLFLEATFLVSKKPPTLISHSTANLT